jgi:Tfp pilus assembly protein PilN
MTKEISLTSIQTAPIDFKSNEVKINQNLIIVEGYCSDKKGLSEFLINLNQSKWLNQASLIYYKLDKKDKEISNFKISVTINKLD